MFINDGRERERERARIRLKYAVAEGRAIHSFIQKNSFAFFPFVRRGKHDYLNLIEIMSPIVLGIPFLTGRQALFSFLHSLLLIDDTSFMNEVKGSAEAMSMFISSTSTRFRSIKAFSRLVLFAENRQEISFILELIELVRRQLSSTCYISNKQLVVLSELDGGGRKATRSIAHRPSFRQYFNLRFSETSQYVLVARFPSRLIC